MKVLFISQGEISASHFCHWARIGEEQMRMMNSAKALIVADESIEIVAPEKSDFFIDELHSMERNNAPFYYETVDGDFVMSARVKPGFNKNYDAGGLFIYDAAKRWIKLEFEKTDLGYPSVVSVVTNGTSDDCNGENLYKSDSVFLQIARNGEYWALHYSLNGKKWSMVRYFKLKMKQAVKVGLEAQSPIGKYCKVEFSEIKMEKRTISDMRKGI
jgi:uncharacterized protein